jgi:hypothetical protein
MDLITFSIIMAIVGTVLTAVGTVLTIIGVIDRKRERERTAKLSAKEMVPALITFLTALGIPITDVIRARLEAMANATTAFITSLTMSATLHDPVVVTEYNRIAMDRTVDTPSWVNVNPAHPEIYKPPNQPPEKPPKK